MKDKGTKKPSKVDQIAAMRVAKAEREAKTAKAVTRKTRARGRNG